MPARQIDESTGRRSLPAFALRLHNVSTIRESASAASKVARVAHMRLLVDQLQKLEEGLRAGGGPAKVERQHRAGKMTARERIATLIDPGTPFLELGLLLAYDQYDGEAPGPGSVTGIGKIEGRYAVRSARAGNRHAQPRPHRLPGGLGGHQPAVPPRLGGAGSSQCRVSERPGHSSSRPA